MKKIFIAIVALAAATACSNNELVSVNQEAIAFDNAFVNNSTRSVVDPSYSNTNLFSDFAVYGFVTGDNTAPIFDCTKVSGSALNGDWTYEGTQYWIEGATYNFYAVAPHSYLGYWVGNTANADGLVLYVQNNDGTKDILVAKANDIEGQHSGDNDPVEFNFQHILSKVKFSFTNNYDATGSSIRVENIKITNACGGSYVTFTKNNLQWGNGNPSAQAPTLNFGMATDAEETADVKENVEVAYAYGKTYESQNELLLIPVSGPEYTLNGETVKGYNVTFDVKVLVNSVVVKTYNHSVNVDFTPVAGHSYDIKAVISATNINPDEALDPIEFTVTGIDGWDETDANKTI